MKMIAGHIILISYIILFAFFNLSKACMCFNASLYIFEKILKKFQESIPSRKLQTVIATNMKC